LFWLNILIIIWGPGPRVSPQRTTTHRNSPQLTATHEKFEEILIFFSQNLVEMIVS
jgi:hypothetical protein